MSWRSSSRGRRASSSTTNNSVALTLNFVRNVLFVANGASIGVSCYLPFLVFILDFSRMTSMMPPWGRIYSSRRLNQFRRAFLFLFYSLSPRFPARGDPSVEVVQQLGGWSALALPGSHGRAPDGGARAVPALPDFPYKFVGESDDFPQIATFPLVKRQLS